MEKIENVMKTKNGETVAIYRNGKIYVKARKFFKVRETLINTFNCRNFILCK